ncbi:MAG: hypothetical protein ACOC8C_00820 [Chloroflexota bacterium]
MAVRHRAHGRGHVGANWGDFHSSKISGVAGSTALAETEGDVTKTDAAGLATPLKAVSLADFSE